MDYKKPQSTLVQGGAGIYPLTTADQVILADGSRLEKDGRISADSAANSANSAKLGGKAPEYYIQPRNLLDNSDFRNPVNQRGVASWFAEIGIDRWYAWPSANDYALKVTDVGILAEIEGSGGTTRTTLQQRLPKGTIDTSKSYTIAAFYNNGTLKISHAGDEAGEDLKPLIDTTNADFDFVNVYMRNGECIVWAALYEGSYTVETLPPYVPKGYAAELAECQRYFIADVGTHKTGTIVDNVFEMYILLPTQMRIVPTAILKLPDNIVFNIGEAKIVAVKSASVTYFKNLLVGITLDIGNTGKQYAIGATYLTRIDLSADL